MLSVRALLGIAFAACLAPAAAQTCNETFFSAASKDPQLGLLATAVSAISSSSTGGIIPSPALGITIFAPTDDALLGYFGDQGLSLASAAGVENQLVATLLQHVIPNATTLDRLVQEKSVQSALGALLNASYPITASNTSGSVSCEDRAPLLVLHARHSTVSLRRSSQTVEHVQSQSQQHVLGRSTLIMAHMQVTVSGKANPTPAHVLKTTKLCNSYVYNIDQILEPAANISAVPSVTLAQATAYTSGGGSGSPAGSPSAAATAPAAAPGSAAAPSTAPAPQGAAQASSLPMRGGLAGLLVFAATFAVI